MDWREKVGIGFIIFVLVLLVVVQGYEYGRKTMYQDSKDCLSDKLQYDDAENAIECCFTGKICIYGTIMPEITSGI